MEAKHFASEHSKEPDYTHIGETLAAINDELNSGRGCSAIRDVVSELQSGHIEMAKATIVNEWDKIGAYPEVANYLVGEGIFVPIDFSKYDQ